ncbi:MAG: hypothetical protein EA385_10640 [Salinarimonadaceae bacterium]|nr:MAG: hypothetical protein EA385_10640 [Salinarimonadaceae bacterium]
MPLIVQSPPESRQIVIDDNGVPAAGAKLFFFDAGTTTPQVTYSDAGLSIPLPHPVVADSRGRVPRIYLLEGQYRIRVERSDGLLLYDDDDIQGSFQTAEQGETPEFDPTGVASTGQIAPAYDLSTRAGWVRLNGRSIGTPSSGATERANADTEALYLFLWQRDADVQGGRGASGAADWAANKALFLPDFRGRAAFVSDTMGSTAAERLTDLVMTPDGATLGATGGAQAVPLTEAQLPEVTKTTSNNGNHTHPVNQPSGGNFGAAGGGINASPGSSTQSTGTAGAHDHTVTFGGGENHPNIPPAIVVGAYIKL